MSATATGAQPEPARTGPDLCGHREAHSLYRVCTYPAGHDPIVDPFAADPDYAVMLAGTYDHGDARLRSWWSVCRERGCWCAESEPTRQPEADTAAPGPAPADDPTEWAAAVAARRTAGWRCGPGLFQGHCDDPAHQPWTATPPAAATPALSAHLRVRLQNLAVDLRDDGSDALADELQHLLGQLPTRP